MAFAAGGTSRFVIKLNANRRDGPGRGPPWHLRWCGLCRLIATVIDWAFEVLCCWHFGRNADDLVNRHFQSQTREPGMW
ncbi:hypothetical protein ZEAMMB73_Zm00001d016455 [Zea mays]|uniref:Uncharacterized protein n=1 Tax=Zea mays TaxID=4577 RepID=A0A1D6H7W4_MAIZE|nr:hypothetical protein ZEAMMB73_Zm00001d016455 [Zea mays]